jgi:HAMP domain-containing protein
MRAVAAVETSAAPLAEHRAAIVRRTTIVVLALLVVGCLVSLGISKLIAGEIGRLTRAAKAFAAGDYDARLAPGPVEEVAVVGSTFGIMGSVLKDATLRSTREMLQFERFNTEANLSEQYADRFAAPVAITHAGLSLAIDRLGPAMHGDFWFVRTEGPRSQACLGRVDRAASFDAVLAASAAGTLLQDALARGQSAPDALAQAADLFPLHCCVLLEWGTAGAPPTLHRLRSGEPLTRSPLDPRPGRTVALTTLDAESDRKAARYADAYAFDTPRSCVEELRRFFGDGTPGGVLALQVTSS